MIDPGYIPEDLTQYLLNYSGSQEEHNSYDDAQPCEVDSSDYGSIFIPPHASTPREPHESFQDSGMSEDDSDSDLSPLQNKAKKDIILKPAKENTKPQKKTTKNLLCDSTKTDQNKKAVNPRPKRRKSEKPEKQPKKARTIQKNKTSKTSSPLIPQDVASVSSKSKRRKVEQIEKETLDVSCEDEQSPKASSKTAKKWPLPSNKAKDNSPPNLSKKRKKAKRDSGEIKSPSGGIPNQDTQNSQAMEILGDISSSEDESDADDNSFFSRSTGTKNSTNKNTSKDLQAAADGSGKNSILTDFSKNHLGSISSVDTKELSRKVTSIIIDSSSSGETDNPNSVSSRKKPTKSSSKATKKICTTKTEVTQDCSSFLFDVNETLVTSLRKNKNRNVPLRVNTKSSTRSKPKGDLTDNAGSKKDKTKHVGKKSRGAAITDTHPGEKSPSPKRKNAIPQRTKTPKKSATKGDCDDESTASPEKNTSVKPSPQKPLSMTPAERHKMYRKKRKQYFEDLEKEVVSLRKENEALTTSSQVNSLDHNMSTNDCVTDEDTNKVEKKNQETSLFIQDLKAEIQQLQREKKNLISEEDMESIVDDFRGEVNQLKKQKKDLEMKGKKTDLLVCSLRRELEQMKKQNEELEIERNNTSTDIISVLEKERNEMKSKAREMELFIEDLKKDVKDLSAEKEDCARRNKEMNLLVNKWKEEINTLKKSKDDLVINEKEMGLNIKDLREKLDGLKKQNDDHEKNARETESVTRHLREELEALKTEKAVEQDNAREMESTITSLKMEISALKKEEKEQETKFKNLEREKVSYQSSIKDIESVISTLKDKMIELKTDPIKAT